MRRFTLAALVLAFTLAASVAHADPIPAGTTGIYTTPVIVIYGRPAKPMVAVVVKTPTTTEAAGSAHEAFRVRLLSSTEAESRSLEPR